MVQKLWDFCDVLRDDGLSYGDYLEEPLICCSSRWPMSSMRCSAVTASCPSSSVGSRC